MVKSHDRGHQVDITAVSFHGMLSLEFDDDRLQRSDACLDLVFMAAVLHLIEAGDEWFDDLEGLVGE